MCERLCESCGAPMHCLNGQSCSCAKCRTIFAFCPKRALSSIQKQLVIKPGFLLVYAGGEAPEEEERLP